MPNNPVSPALPADLPTDWVYGQTIGPNGTDVGLTPQHGYNYLMQAVNAVQAAANALGQAIAALDASSVGADPSGTAASAVSTHNTNESAHQDIRTALDNLDSNLGLQIYQHVTNYANPHIVTATQVGALQTSGGTMTGGINMGGFGISNLGAPAQDDDAATKAYVDGAVVIGSYTGNGGANRTINLGFEPSAVLIMHESGSTSDSNGCLGGLATKSVSVTSNIAGVGSPPSYEDVISIVSNGFALTSNYSTQRANVSGYQYNYVAWR